MSPDEFTGGPDELYTFVDDASANPTFYADLRNPQSLNKYEYSYNNPLRFVDPDGHDTDDAQDPKPMPGQALPIPITPVAPPTVPIGVPPGLPMPSNPLKQLGIVGPDPNAIPPQRADEIKPVPLPTVKPPDISQPIIPSDTQFRFGESPNKRQMDPRPRQPEQMSPRPIDKPRDKGHRGGKDHDRHTRRTPGTSPPPGFKPRTPKRPQDMPPKPPKPPKQRGDDL